MTMGQPVFISHASKDQKIAESICDALEKDGFGCWLASRDVGPGENFQESIVRAIRSAKVLVLIFTSNANTSAEIKKELVLASQNNLTVIPVRMEDVQPNDALAYEFATRQWIDLFQDRERALDRLSKWIADLVPTEPSVPRATTGKLLRGSSGTAEAISAPAPTQGTRPPLTALAKAHRATGILLYFGTLLLAWWLTAASRGPDSYVTVHAAITSLPGTAILIAYALALLFHMGRGIYRLIRAVGKPLPAHNPMLVWYQRVTAVANVPLTIAVLTVFALLYDRPHVEVVQALRSHFIAVLLLLFLTSIITHMRIGMEFVIQDSMRGDLWRPLVLMANTFYAVAIGLACVYAILLLAFGV
jgi:succinate dehydrogenase hydrophobic membrane anchor protein/succinate dehydrogenase cytochrome b556 subunit